MLPLARPGFDQSVFCLCRSGMASASVAVKFLRCGWLGLVILLLQALWLAPVAADDVLRAPDYTSGSIMLLQGGQQTPLKFDVRFAQTPEQHRFGLMFSPPLAPQSGMLFIFEDAAPRSFWMKNTPIALDMLFFAADGRLVTTIANAAPHSLTPRRSKIPAKYVLEIGDGEASRLGLGAGTRLQLPLVSE